MSVFSASRQSEQIDNNITMADLESRLNFQSAPQLDESQLDRNSSV